ncbi:hypothetical protein RS75_21945 [Rhizobium nepotum 39/7]|uniref:Uncharacterized protein n=1 Tax=Rhizobium nepotum 39/7 TaxID=1368418 RepID=A0ABR5CL96_9HYPH|nr:hypothetical protein RS75_21945 [Rhizobium nepotum 39/7]
MLFRIGIPLQRPSIYDDMQMGVRLVGVKSGKIIELMRITSVTFANNGGAEHIFRSITHCPICRVFVSTVRQAEDNMTGHMLFGITNLLTIDVVACLLSPAPCPIGKLIIWNESGAMAF